MNTLVHIIQLDLCMHVRGAQPVGRHTEGVLLLQRYFYGAFLFGAQ